MNKNFNKKVQAHFSTLMHGTLGPQALFGLGDDFELVQDIHEYYDLDNQLNYIKYGDMASVS